MDTEGVHVAKRARLSFCGIFWVIFVHIMHDCKPSTLDADVKLLLGPRLRRKSLRPAPRMYVCRAVTHATASAVMNTPPPSPSAFTRLRYRRRRRQSSRCLAAQRAAAQRAAARSAAALRATS